MQFGGLGLRAFRHKSVWESEIQREGEQKKEREREREMQREGEREQEGQAVRDKASGVLSTLSFGNLSASPQNMLNRSSHCPSTPNPKP